MGPTTGQANGSMIVCRATTAFFVIVNVVRSCAIVTGPSYFVRISLNTGPTVS